MRLRGRGEAIVSSRLCAFAAGRWVAALALAGALAGLAGCGGGSSSASEWVRIDAPVDGLSTGATSVVVEGNAALAQPTPIQWTNLEAGLSGELAQQTIVITAFRGNVPLTLGPNTIVVRLGTDGPSDTVRVTRYPQVTLSGYVGYDTHAYVPAVTVSLSGDRDQSIRVDGSYAFEYLREGHYTIAPSLPPPQDAGCLAFAPTRRDVEVPLLGATDVFGLDFEAMPLAACYRVAGRVTSSVAPFDGLEGVRLVLKDLAGAENAVTTYSGGWFDFWHLAPGVYTVTPLGGSFAPPTATLTITDADLQLDLVRLPD